MSPFKRPSYGGYTGGGWWQLMPPGVKSLLIANGGVFLLQLATKRALIDLFGLTPAAVIHQLALYQLVTYMFLHGGFFHIAINMFILWMFGVAIEQSWGTRRFLFYYFLTGVAGGVFTVAIHPNSIVPTVGASGGIYGLLVAYAVMFPNQTMYLYFLIPMKVKYAVILFVGLEFLASLSVTSDGVGHLAHLGGAVVGFVYLKLDWRARRFFHRMSPSRLIETLRYRRKMSKLQHNQLHAEEIMRRVDQILDRINEVGIENISEEERRFLGSASDVLSKKKK